MFQQKALDELPTVVEVFTDELKLLRYGVEGRLARRSGRTLLKHAPQRLQGIRHSRQSDTQPGVCFREIRRRGYASEMDRPLPHVVRRARHGARHDRKTVVRNLVVDDGELDPRGHLKCVLRSGIDVGADGAGIPFVGISAARGAEHGEDRNERAESVQNRPRRAGRLRSRI